MIAQEREWKEWAQNNNVRKVVSFLKKGNQKLSKNCVSKDNVSLSKLALNDLHNYP